MRKLSFLLVSVVVLACGGGAVDPSEINASTVKNNYSALENFSKETGGAVIVFNEKEHEFPPMVQGEELNHTFYFVNAGDEPLILTNVKGSCGCTNVNYPEQPIMPGDKGAITATINTSGKTVGKEFRVAVRVESNAKIKKEKLWVKGTPKAE